MAAFTLALLVGGIVTAMFAGATAVVKAIRASAQRED